MTMNYSGNLNLEKLVNAQAVKMKIGDGKAKSGIFIPIEDNPSIFQNEKGTYLGITCYESQGNEYGNSHFVAAHVGNKEAREKLGDKEAIRAVEPILGNLRELVFDRQLPEAEAEPVQRNQPENTGDNYGLPF